MIGVYYVHLFACNMLVGWIGGYLEKMPAGNFWLLHAGLVAAGGVGLLIVRSFAGRILAPDEASPAEAFAKLESHAVTIGPLPAGSGPRHDGESDAASRILRVYRRLRPEPPKRYAARPGPDPARSTHNLTRRSRRVAPADGFVMGEKLLAQRLILLLRETKSETSRTAHAVLEWTAEQRDWLWPQRRKARGRAGTPWRPSRARSTRATRRRCSRFHRTVSRLLELDGFEAELLAAAVAFSRSPRL